MNEYIRHTSTCVRNRHSVLHSQKVLHAPTPIRINSFTQKQWKTGKMTSSKWLQWAKHAQDSWPELHMQMRTPVHSNTLNRIIPYAANNNTTKSFMQSFTQQCSHGVRISLWSIVAITNVHHYREVIPHDHCHRSTVAALGTRACLACAANRWSHASSRQNTALGE